MKPPTSPVRGMRDLLPPEVALREHATATILGAYRRFGFQRVETPAVEHAALLAGSQGGENEKLVYRILKRGEKLDLPAARGVDDLSDEGLRFDLTVPLARFYAAHHGQLGRPFKAIQVGPVWRAERPQKGRYRQFTQCDIDVLGEPSLLAEVDLLQATCAALADLGLSGFVVRLNDRRWLDALLERAGVPAAARPAALVAIDKRDKIGWDGVRAELLGGLPEPAVVALLAELSAGEPATTARAAGSGPESVATLLALLAGRLPAGARLRWDPTLVRGMGYYTGPIFEVGIEEEGFSIAGGGRYDEMIGRIGGAAVPACGFSIGFERVVLLLEQRGLLPSRERRLLALLHEAGPDTLPAVLTAADTLRDRGLDVSVLGKRKKLAAQLGELAAQGFDLFLAFDPTVPIEGQEVRPLG